MQTLGHCTDRARSGQKMFCNLEQRLIYIPLTGILEIPVSTDTLTRVLSSFSLFFFFFKTNLTFPADTNLFIVKKRIKLTGLLTICVDINKKSTGYGQHCLPICFLRFAPLFLVYTFSLYLYNLSRLSY